MKVTLEPYVLQNSTALDASFIGNQFECIAYYGLGIQLNVVESTALSGVFSIQFSNDGINYFNSNILVPITLTALAANATYGFTGAPGLPAESSMIPWKYLKIIWTRSAGTGFVTALVTGVRV